MRSMSVKHWLVGLAASNARSPASSRTNGRIPSTIAPSRKASKRRPRGAPGGLDSSEFIAMESGASLFAGGKTAMPLWTRAKARRAFRRLLIFARMSDNSNLPERVAALEKAAAEKRCTRIQRVGRLGVILFAGFLTWNVWLLNQSLSARRQSGSEHQFWVVGHANYPARERGEAFLALVAAGNKEWRGAHLDGLKLGGVSLPNADLHGADFNSSDLSRASFIGAKFARAKLAQTDLSETDFTEADLAGADLLQAQLKRAQLRRANLRGAILEQAEAQDAMLIAADLSDAYLLMANLSGANLGAANLNGASLEAAVLKQANLSLTRLTRANLKDADFSDANWWRARGLASDQIALLVKKFPPTEKAPAALRDDYQAWLKTLEPGK